MSCRDVVPAIVLQFCFACFVAPALAGFESPGTGPNTKGDPQNPKFWSVTARTSLGFDNNVNAVSDGDTWFHGDTGSAYAALSIDANARTVIRPTWTVGAALRLDQTLHFRDADTSDPNVSDSPREYDLTVVNPTLFAEHVFVMNGMPASAGVSYSYRFESGDIESIGIDAHAMNLNGSMKIKPDTQVGVNLSIVRNDFEVAFPDEELFGRDGTFIAFGLSGRKRFRGYARSAGAHYTFSKNNADGQTFNYIAHTIGFDYRTQVVGPYFGKVGVNYGSHSYKEQKNSWIPAPGRENQKILGIVAQAIWVINQAWSADASIAWSDYASNQSLFEGDRAVAGAGITRRF